MALAKPALLSIEEAAARGATRVAEGHLVPFVAEELIDAVDPGEWRRLAVRGLGDYIHDRRNAERQYARALPDEADGVETCPAIDHAAGSIRHLQPRNVAKVLPATAWVRVLEQSYRVGDVVKAVLDMSPGDTTTLTDNYRGRAYGNHKRADAFAFMTKAMTEHKVDTVRQLPKAVQQIIAGMLR